jgi:hypothetical protein
MRAILVSAIPASNRILARPRACNIANGMSHGRGSPVLLLTSDLSASV